MHWYCVIEGQAPESLSRLRLSYRFVHVVSAKDRLTICPFDWMIRQEPKFNVQGESGK